MSTYMPKAGEIERSWYVIDAAGKPMGRVAALAASLLRGKQKPIFTPHVDCGDHVIIINCSAAVLTGRKLEKKYYRYPVSYRHLDVYKRQVSASSGSTMATSGVISKSAMGYLMPFS